MADLYEITQTPQAMILSLRIDPGADSDVFDTLNDSLMRAIEACPGLSWVVDLGEVGYFRSAMLGLLVNLHTRVQGAGGQLVLCNLPRRLMDIIQTCCLERLFSIVKGRTEALDSLNGAGN